MKRNIVLWQSLGFVATSLLGVLLHFLFDWSGIAFTALFSAVNESTWEHMKLIFFPMFLFACVQYFFIGKEYNYFWCIKLRGILVGVVLIPALFYTLRGIFGTMPDWINIAIFFVSVAAAYIYETKQFQKDNPLYKYCGLAFVTLCIIAISFALFTFIPPEIPLFQDPLNGNFGV